MDEGYNSEKELLDSYEELERIISNIWLKKIPEDFRKRYFVRYESTLVACFYFHLRRKLNKFPLLRVFLESTKSKKSKKMHHDLIIYKYDSKEEINEQEVNTLKFIGKPLIVIEFKIVGKITSKQFREIKNDVKRLSLSAEENSSIERCYMLYLTNRKVDNIDEYFTPEKWLKFKNKLIVGIGINEGITSIKNLKFCLNDF